MSTSSAVSQTKTRLENIAPILNVRDIEASVRYYVDVLGFSQAPWGGTFTFVRRDNHCIYLCQDGQGHAGTWMWVGVEDVEALYEEYVRTGAMIRHPPRNFPWALEMHVKDPDGHVLRFGSDPKTDRPYESFID